MNNNNNNLKKLKEIISECNGNFQEKGKQLETYCSIIPLLMGRRNCKYQSSEIIHINETNGIKDYLVPRYLCLWKGEEK